MKNRSKKPYSCLLVAATTAAAAAATFVTPAGNSGAYANEHTQVYYEAGAAKSADLTANSAVPPYFVRDHMKTDPEAVKAYLAKRYGVKPTDIQFTPNDHYPIIVRNKDRASLRPSFDAGHIIPENTKYDVVVIGCGPAGLTSSLYLTDAGLNVLCIERQSILGGLAMGSSLNGIRVGGGAAYSVGAEGKKREGIFKHIGLPHFKKEQAISEPIDSLLTDKQYVLGIWEEQSLKKLPASFALFKHALEHASDEGMLDRTTEAAVELDKIDFETFIKKMPEMVSKMTDSKSKKIYQRFLADKRLPADNPMADVLALMELYGRSALGKGPHYVSARQFGNFYDSELDTRYTGVFGTGEITGSILKKLKDGKHHIAFHTNSSVAKIENVGDNKTLTTYVHKGKTYQVESKKVVFAISVKEALDLIDGFAKMAPERAKILNNLEMTDYNVHVVRLKGHPFRDGYDLWVMPSDYTEKEPTDIINGRWLDPKINGYEKMRDFKKNPSDDYGALTIYHSLGETTSANDDRVLDIAENGVRFMKKTIEPLLKPQAKENGPELDIELVETFRYPESIHVVAPGWLTKAKVLAQPLGNIYFGNNTLGGPEVEFALEMGFDAAQGILHSFGTTAVH